MSDGQGGTVLEAAGLGRRFGHRWAVRDCDVDLPAGRVAALVGPNGAGKSTLLRLATGLLSPSEGTVTTLGQRPGVSGAPRGVGFLSQDRPLYPGFRVGEMLRAAAVLNPGNFDTGKARQLVDDAGLGERERVGGLSSGQRGRLALALVLGRRPRLLLLDEPLRDLDPLARREVVTTVLGEVADTAMTVLFSSHVLTELEDVCDHLVIMRDGAVRLAGDIDALLAQHRVVVGAGGAAPQDTVVHERDHGRQRTALVRGPAGTGEAAYRPTLEELVLGYLRPSRGPATDRTAGEAG